MNPTGTLALVAGLQAMFPDSMPMYQVQDTSLIAGLSHCQAGGAVPQGGGGARRLGACSWGHGSPAPAAPLPAAARLRRA